MINNADLICLKKDAVFNDNSLIINELYSSQFIETHFDKLSKDYWMSDVFSLNLLSYCRQKAIQKVDIQQGAIVLDMMSGTGKNFPLLSQKVGNQGRVIGLDISEKMNALAQIEVEKQRLLNVDIYTKDFFNNEFPSESIDVIVGTFGLKTLSPDTYSLFSKEIKRLLKPQGRFVLIELSEPPNIIFKTISTNYLKHFVPFFSKILRGDKDAHLQLYPYLSSFKNCRGIAQSLSENGLEVSAFSLFSGLVTGVVGRTELSSGRAAKYL